jgi:arsenate reductase
MSTSGDTMSPPVVLFLCIGNSCRSPMAEAIAGALGGDLVKARSAGFAPTGWIAPDTVSTLEEMGYGAAGLHSKGLDDVPIDDVDVVVSLIGDGGLRLVPITVGTRRESWMIRDPYGDDRDVYRAVARDLETRIRRLLEDLARDTPDYPG